MQNAIAPCVSAPNERERLLVTEQLQVLTPAHEGPLRLPNLALRPLVQRAFRPGHETTWLFATLAGLVQPESGRLWLQSQEIDLSEGHGVDYLRTDGVGTYFDFSELHHGLSPIDNVLLACRYAPGRRQRAQQQHGNLRKAALHILRQLAFDLDAIHHATPSLEPIDRLRLLLARALIGAPPLVIIDALHTQHAQEWALLKQVQALCQAQGSGLLFAPRAYL